MNLSLSPISLNGALWEASIVSAVTEMFELRWDKGDLFQSSVAIHESTLGVPHKDLRITPEVRLHG